jgi:hypothetical protein
MFLLIRDLTSLSLIVEKIWSRAQSFSILKSPLHEYPPNGEANISFFWGIATDSNHNQCKMGECPKLQNEIMPIAKHRINKKLNNSLTNF